MLGGVYHLLANSGAELRSTPPGRVNDYHTASRRQYARSDLNRLSSGQYELCVAAQREHILAA